MNKLSPADRARVLVALMEGNSINSTVRMTGIAHTTILRLITEVGDACLRFHDAQVRGLSTTSVQCDEVWSFCFSKEKNTPVEMRGHGRGSIWTWTALDADTKLMISWVVSDRSQEAANAIMADLKMRTTNRMQINSTACRVTSRPSSRRSSLATLTTRRSSRRSPTVSPPVT